MIKNSSDHIISANEIDAEYFSIILKHLDIKSSISQEDKNLLFIDYEGLISEDLEIDPSLTVYFDQDSKFVRFDLINEAPELITQKIIGPLINSMNKNYVLTSYESIESEGKFYISSEYWMNYKFGFDPTLAHYIIMMMPSLLSGALGAELSKLK